MVGTISGGRRAFQTLALWLGLIALTVHGLVPLCMAGMTASTSGHSVVICTAQGFTKLFVGADGKPFKNAPDSHHQTSDCPVCSTCHMGGGFTTPVPVALALPAYSEFETVRFFLSAAVSWPLHFFYVSRAPPQAA
jgi:hypothetical protein